MRQVTRNGLITVAAASGVLATFSGGTAYADSGAQGASIGSPGLLSGNTVQVPVHVPVNACGNTVSVLGVLNPAMGNHCSNGGSRSNGDSRSNGGSGAQARGTSQGSPGIGSGNTVQAPVDVPVNLCGNGVSVAGTLNPVADNSCSNGSSAQPPVHHHPWHPAHHHPGTPERPTTHKPVDRTPVSAEAPKADVQTPSRPMGELAHTGMSEGIGIAAPLSAGLLIGGFVLYRRSRAMQR